LSVSTGPVEVDQDVARLSAFARANNAAIFQFIHDAGGAGVAEAQPALQQGYARLLLAADDFDALLDQVFIFVDAVFSVEAADRFGELLVDFHLVARFALALDEFDDGVDFLVGDERAWARLSLAEPGGR